MTTGKRYSRTAMSLHWLIALLILFAFGLGLKTEALPRGAALFAVFQLHKSVGITILLLSLWRLGIRVSGSHPPPVEAKGAVRRLAQTIHWLFYVIMIGVPLSGWLIVSTSETRVPTVLYGIIPWPHLPVSGEALHEAAETFHGVVAEYGIPLLLALHLAGVVRHQLLLKEPLLERMTPLRRPGVLSLVLLIGSLSAAFLAGRFAPIAEALYGASQPKPAATAPEPALPPAPIEQAPANASQPVEPASADETEGDEAPAENARWAVQPGGTLGFAVTVSGEKVNGRFGRWDAAIDFTPDAPEKGRIRATVDLASVASGDGERDGMLADGDWFATATHPRATFVSNDIRSLGGTRYEARGTLTLKGVSRPLRLPFTLDIKDDTARVRGSAAFDRRSFKVGEGQFSETGEVGGDIAVSLAFTARRQP
jgi:cytochrome b561/polyisoprenoid-binding protein YceI